MLGFRSQLCGFLLACPQGDPPKPPPAAAPVSTERPGAGDAVARVNGVELPLEGFRDWVVATHGWRHLDDYIDLALLRQETARLGLALPTAAELDAAFEQDWRDQILLRHGGTEAGWLEELTKAGLDRAGYRDRRAGTLEIEVVARRLLQRQRMKPEQYRELWEKEFGKAGERVHVRVAFFSKLRSVRPGQRVDQELGAKLEAEARERADRFLAAVTADRASFGRLVGSDCDLFTVPRFDTLPIDLRPLGGEIERLRSDHFGGAVLAGLGAAKAGDLVGPLSTPSGNYVVEIVKREAVPFESATAELEAIWAARAPSASEVFHLRQELRTKAAIERYPLHR